jgi:hypothetical protein
VRSATGPAGPVSGDAAQRAAQDELRRVMYHRDDPSIVDRAVNWVGGHLSHLVDGSVSGSALLLVLILLLGLAIFAITRAGRPRRGARHTGTADPLAPLARVDHRRLAEELTAQGRRAEALREWLRATVASIEGRGILDARPGRTGSEIAREAGAVLPAADDALRIATTAFDQVWFGERPATDADVLAGRTAADAIGSARLQDRGRPSSGYAVPR